MAKCVRVVGQGIPVRLPDDEAFCFVHLMGDGEYCSKAVWRNYWRESEYGKSQGGISAGYMRLSESDRQWLLQNHGRRVERVRVHHG